LKINKPKIIQFSFFFIILLWCTAIIIEPLISIFPKLTYILPFLKYNFSIVCHTEQDKLFNFGDYHTLVCSRCAGIYFGSLISAILILLGLKSKLKTKILLLGSIPMLLDVILYSIGIYSYSKYIALFTGLLLGSLGFIYIQESLIELFVNKKGKK
jgi:uncharacterized membrane protein